MSNPSTGFNNVVLDQLTANSNLQFGVREVSAIGSNQATALTLNAFFSAVLTAPTSSGVVLPAVTTAQIGSGYMVANRSAAGVFVYPPAGGSNAILGLSDNAPQTLAANKTNLYVAVSTTRWAVMIST